MSISNFVIDIGYFIYTFLLKYKKMFVNMRMFKIPLKIGYIFASLKGKADKSCGCRLEATLNLFFAL